MIPTNAQIREHPETGRLHARVPAGGTGGGVTSFVDLTVSDREHVALLYARAERKQAEADAAKQKADEAATALNSDEILDQAPEQDEPKHRPA